MTAPVALPMWKRPPRTKLEAIRRVRRLLAKPERWTKHHPARDAIGLPCDADAPRATQCCLNGALCRAGAFSDVAPTLAKVKPHYITFNDRLRTTHADILALLDRVEARIRKAGAP